MLRTDRFAAERYAVERYAAEKLIVERLAGRMRALGLAVLLFCLFLIPAGTVMAAEFEEEDWTEWLQEDSSYAAVSDSGCRVVSMARMIAESGVAPDITPDELYEWGLEHGAFSRGKSGYRILEKGSFGSLLTSYVTEAGGEVELEACIDISRKKTGTVAELIMEYLEDGCYVSLMCTSHTVYVGREISLEEETPVVMESVIYRGEEDNLIVYEDGTHVRYAKLYAYRIRTPEQVAEARDLVLRQQGILVAE